MSTMVKVAIIMGSESDLPTMEEAEKVLTGLGIESETRILSAHRTPQLLVDYLAGAEKKGIKVVIAGAGMANHLAGAVAAHSVIPVIGVPLEASSLNGLDALLSTVQMPPGVPVACVALGRAGAKNAGFLAAQILGLGDPAIRERLLSFRTKAKETIAKKNEELAKKKDAKG